MLYVARDGNGEISEAHPVPTGAAQEGLPADNPEVLAFIHERWRQNELHEMDRDSHECSSRNRSAFRRRCPRCFECLC